MPLVRLNGWQGETRTPKKVRVWLDSSRVQIYIYT